MNFLEIYLLYHSALFFIFVLFEEQCNTFIQAGLYANDYKYTYLFNLKNPAILY